MHHHLRFNVATQHDLKFQGRRKQFSCGQAKSSQCIVLGSGVRKHAKTRGVENFEIYSLRDGFW